MIVGISCGCFCPCWPPLFFCLGGEQNILQQQCKILHPGERVSAPVALIYSIRNRESGEIECGGKKSNNNLPDTQNSLTHSYTLKHSSTHRREGFRELGHVKFCSSLFLIDCVHHQGENKRAASRQRSSFSADKQEEVSSRADGLARGPMDAMHLCQRWQNTSTQFITSSETKERYQQNLSGCSSGWRAALIRHKLHV